MSPMNISAAVPLRQPAPTAPIFERLLTEAGRQRLAAGVMVYLETFCDSDHYYGPAWSARLLDQRFVDPSAMLRML